MNISVNSAIASIAYTSYSGSTATAPNIPTQSLSSTVQSTLGGSGQVKVSLEDGVATLVGYVYDSYIGDEVKLAVMNYPGVDHVIDRIVST